jgi:hypothetical protein
MDTPDVILVCRDSDGWHAMLSGHGLVRARSLQALDRRIHALAGGTPASYRFRTGDDELDRLVRRLHIARTAARRYEAESRRLVDQVVLKSRLSQRDTSVLVGLSHQRVYQLLDRRRAMGAETERHGATGQPG